MKKTININLGGFAFTMDDDAYYLLNSYIQDVESRLTDKETLIDIESRIAEIFRENLSINIYVVNAALVNRAISTIGMPDNFGERSYVPPMPRKLMRDPEHKVIGGVCSGLAAYFHVEISLIRVIALLLIFVGGMSVWVYIILWIVIPIARTDKEKEMLRQNRNMM